jgi:hypothetical protein
MGALPAEAVAMAELALRDGYSRPGDLPDGEFYSTFLDDETMRIDHADPRILVSAELVDQAAFRVRPDIELSLDHAADGHVGALLKIRGTNRTVIYRLAKYIPAVRGYIAEWPD